MRRLAPFHSQASEAGGEGICRGSDTPTIYVGILICRPISPYKNLIPNHANCMQHVPSCWERQSDDTEYKKTRRRPAFRPTPRCGSLQRSSKPPSWWGGAGCRSPRTPLPALGPSGLTHLSYPHSKISYDAVVFIMRHNCSLHLMVASPLYSGQSE